MQMPGPLFKIILTVVVSSWMSSCGGGGDGGGGGTNPAAATCLNSPPTERICLLKEFTDDPVLPGGTATLEFTIANKSQSFAATAISFSDDLTATLAGLVAVGLPANTCGGTISGTSTLTFTGGSLAAGASCTISVTLQISAGTAFGTIATNTTSQLTGTLDGLPITADPASDELRIFPPPSFNKNFAPASIGVGGTSTMTFTIDNTATPQSAAALDFTDVLPAGMVIATPGNASTTCPGGMLTAASGSSTLSYTGGAVVANGTCTISSDVTSSAAGSYVNTTGDLTSQLGNSGSASATLNVN